jgi:hypothetical protein
MRLIANKGASDSITAYDAAVRLSSIGITEGVKDLRVSVMLSSFKLFDLRCCPELGTPVSQKQFVFPERGELLTYDCKTLTEYFNIVQELKRQFALYRKDLEVLKSKNIRVRDYLKNEYNLK